MIRKYIENVNKKENKFNLHHLIAVLRTYRIGRLEQWALVVHQNLLLKPIKCEKIQYFVLVALT